jgi:hypothetical protein
MPIRQAPVIQVTTTRTVGRQSGSIARANVLRGEGATSFVWWVAVIASIIGHPHSCHVRAWPAQNSLP